MSESILIVVAIIVVAITVLGLAICVLAGYLARIPDSKVTIGEVGRAIGAIVGVGLEAVGLEVVRVEAGGGAGRLGLLLGVQACVQY